MSATVIVVAYRTQSLETSWIPESSELLIVHNDESLSPAAVSHPSARHLHSGSNIGFGAAVNRALREASGTRIILCNPDATLNADSWSRLADATPEEVVSVALVESDGRPNANANPYPTPASLVITSYRVGRFLGIRGAQRTRIVRLLGRWGADWQEALSVQEGRWPLAERWLTGAVLSVDAARMRSVGGFDERYFLYLEDVDLQRRLSETFRSMEAVLAGGPPGQHRSSSSSEGSRNSADLAYAESALLYASRSPGIRWSLARVALRVRRGWLQRRK